MSKYLGQHFLVNKNKLRKIVEALDLKSDDTVIEIGPGHGELTDELRIKNNVSFREISRREKLRIIAIEKDEEFVQYLQKKFAQDKNIEIVKGDTLKILPSIIHYSLFKIQDYKIVGNIPYYITGHLLRILGELQPKPKLIVLTIQKEVGERICGQPLRRRQGFGGQAKMNLLAASVQFWAKPKIIGFIPKTDFRPQPKVDSVIIKFETITLSGRSSIKRDKDDEERYYKLIRILFKQPRKTILNNLKSLTNDNKFLIEKLKALKINPQDRPQNLTLDQIKTLAKQIF